MENYHLLGYIFNEFKIPTEQRTNMPPAFVLKVKSLFCFYHIDPFIQKVEVVKRCSAKKVFYNFGKTKENVYVEQNNH